MAALSPFATVIDAAGEHEQALRSKAALLERRAQLSGPSLGAERASKAVELREQADTINTAIDQLLDERQAERADDAPLFTASTVEKNGPIPGELDRDFMRPCR